MSQVQDWRAWTACIELPRAFDGSSSLPKSRRFVPYRLRSMHLGFGIFRLALRVY